MNRRPHFGSIAGVLFFVLTTTALYSHPVRAATVTVNNLAGTAFGFCNVSLCTLPDAVAAAASGDVINFSVVGIINMNSSLPPISKSLTIDGGGQIAIDGQNNSGIGSIFVVNTAVVTLNLLNLTIQNARAGSGTNFSGGAIYISAASTVNVTNCTFANNQAVNAVLGGGAIGVYNSGATLNVNTSSFANNAASNPNSGAQVTGGAIGSESGGTINIANSLFTGNSSHAASFAAGGAIFTYNGDAKGGTLCVANSTFFNNVTDSSGFGGAINANPGNVLLEITNSTFLSNPAGSTPNSLINFDGVFILDNSIVSNGSCLLTAPIGNNNLVDDSSCGTTLGAVTNLDSAPAYNGGATQTIKLLPNSNAIDAVPSSQCVYPSGFPNLAMFNGGAGHPRERRSARDCPGARPSLRHRRL